MFKALKDLVFVAEPEVAAAPAPVVQAPVQARPTSLTPGIETLPVDPVLDVATIQADIVAVIESQPAFADYLKFANANLSLEKVIVIEGTRLQAAQATTGLTKDQLLASLAVSTAVLESEAQNFEASYVAQAEAAIGDLNSQVTTIDTQLQELTQQLNELSQQKEAITNDALNRSSELAKAKIDFASVAKQVSNRYADAANKIQLHLGA
jgi:hypothetical protein